ncbi:hypothetical protein A8L50_00225 [Pantoea ananatis]|nr:hypothetical protein [Pantoea ananatis]NQE80843.1 hypothetical protein [Pantoea ananatis]CRH33526.1 hypothetical protein BN1183_AV_00240 [Pantoea ananatis]
METIRLTMAQACVQLIDNQYIEVDGNAKTFVKGIFAIFGQGYVLGSGRAPGGERGGIAVCQSRKERRWHVAGAQAGYRKREHSRYCRYAGEKKWPGLSLLIYSEGERDNESRF